MSSVDEPTGGFADDNQLLHLLLGLASASHALDQLLDLPPNVATRPATLGAPDPALAAVLGLVSLQRRLRAALPAPAPAAAPPAVASPIPHNLTR